MPPQFKGAAEPLSQAGLSEALNILGVTPAAIWSVIAVETSGCGFLPDRRPKILFEHHIFHRQTGGHFDAVAPDLSNPNSGGYGHSGAPQYDRLNRAMASFIRHSGIDDALRNGAWDDFAAAYNGPNYQQNQYDEKLDQYFRRYSNGSTPNLTVRAGQMLLMYLGNNPGPIDGVLGQATRDALTRAGAPQSDVVDESILAFLRAKLN